jgi:tetratricopeptide (TPR) repeat protein
MTERSDSTSGHIFVTGDGRHSALHFGSAFALPLDRCQIPPPLHSANRGDYNPLPLLAPDAGILPLVGREAMLAELQAWLDDDAVVSVQTLIARAGTGKTRLALELCKAVDDGNRPGEQGWIAGFIQPSDISAVIDLLATEHYHWTHQTLLVIDNMAVIHRDLARWLDRLMSGTQDNKLRFLLLEREAPADFGWWQDLTRPSDNRLGNRSALFVDPHQPLTLPELDPGEGRNALCEAAFGAAKALPGAPAQHHSLPPTGEAAFAAALAEPRFGNPLNLAMLGLIAAESGPAEALALRQLDAARHLARHELDRIERIARGDGIQGDGIDAASIRHALGFNGLAGGLAITTLHNDLVTEFATAQLPPPPPALCTLLEQEFARPTAKDGEASARYLGTIQPELVGDGMIIETLFKRSAEKTPDFLTERLALRTLCAARRLAFREIALTQSLGQEIDFAQMQPLRAQALRGLIADFGPSHADVLAALAGPKFAERAYDLAKGRVIRVLKRLAQDYCFALADVAASGEDRSTAHAIAVILSSLVEAIPQQDLEQLEDSVLALPQQTLILREIKASQSRRIAGMWKAKNQAAESSFSAMRSLLWFHYLGNQLVAIGQHDDAYSAFNEATILHAGLAQSYPDHTPHLLTDIATRLSEVEDAMKSVPSDQERDTRELLADYATSSIDLPYVHTGQMASILWDLGAKHLDARSLHEGARAAINEAMFLRHHVAEFFLSGETAAADLARYHCEFATYLRDREEQDDAVVAAQAAVDLYRPLAAANPAGFAPDLANALSLLGDSYHAIHNYPDAVEAAHESLQRLSPYFLAQPEVFGDRIRVTVRDYVRRASIGGLKTDWKLADPIAEMLGDGPSSNYIVV